MTTAANKRVVEFGSMLMQSLTLSNTEASECSGGGVVQKKTKITAAVTMIEGLFFSLQDPLYITLCVCVYVYAEAVIC